MNILVCVKQVPDTTEIKIDPVKKTLIREGVPSIVNPYDTYALENAARMRDKDPSVKIYVLSMGPEQAKNALRECLAIAADKAFLITDRAFGGSDTLATSYIISEAIRYVEKQEGIRFDAIFCGKQAIDGDTAQVGPEIAGASGTSAGYLCAGSGGTPGRTEGNPAGTGKERNHRSITSGCCNLYPGRTSCPLSESAPQTGREQNRD